MGAPLVFSLPFKEISMRQLLISTLKGLHIRGVMAILILIGLIIVTIQSAFLLHRLNGLNERLGPIQEKSLELYIEPDAPFEVPIFNFEEGREIAI